MEGAVLSTLLNLIVIFPAIGAIVVALIRNDKVSSRLAKAVAVIEFILTVVVLIQFNTHTGGFQGVSSISWIPSLGISWKVGIDGISLFLVLLTSLLFPIALYSSHEKRAASSYAGWMLLLEASLMGSFLSLDLFSFFVLFELTLIPSYFLIARWGYARSAFAAVKFFVYTFFGSAFLLVGILAVVFIHQSQTGVTTFDLVTLANSTHISNSLQEWLLVAFTVAFAIKAPLFPLHTWSPDTYSESPLGPVVIIASVMAKLGIYGMIRFDLELFPKAAHLLAPLLLTLGVVGIIYGSIVAASSANMRRFVAFSSLSHIGFIVLGLFALSPQGLSGAVIQMFNHGIYTAALLLLIGFIYKRRASLGFDGLGGIQKYAPIMAGMATIVVMASLGLPGTNGFVGEFLILVGTFLTHRWWAVVATTGVILSAVYLLWAYQRIFHGKPSQSIEKEGFSEITKKELALIIPLVALIIFLGVYPKPMLDRVNPTVTALVTRVTHAPSYPSSANYSAQSKG